MDAPTAGSLLRQIAARQRQADAARIADLSDAERAAVVAALEKVPSRSRVDVGRLITSVRREVADHIAASKPEPNLAGIFRYQLSLMSYEALVRLRDELRVKLYERGVTDPFRTALAVASAFRTATPVNDIKRVPDADGDKPPKRRGIPRYVPRHLRDSERVEESVAEDPARVGAPLRGERVSDARSGSQRLFGIRVFDEFGDIIRG